MLAAAVLASKSFVLDLVFKTEIKIPAAALPSARSTYGACHRTARLLAIGGGRGQQGVGQSLPWVTKNEALSRALTGERLTRNSDARIDRPAE